MASDLDLLARDAAHTLRARLFAQLGLAAPLVLGPACSTTSDGGTQGEGGVTTDPSGDGGAEVDSSMTTVMSDESGVMDEGNDDDVRFDVAPDKLDVPNPDPLCTTRWLDPVEVEMEYPGCDLSAIDPGLWFEIIEICIDLPAGVASCSEICVGPNCAGMDECLDQWFWDGPLASCGFYESADGCCSVFAGEPPPPVGRPFVVAGEARLAVAGSPAGTVAAHWLDVARGEHASVAAFANFIADLQRFAAPPRLLSAALAAARDEVEHTRLALAVASRFAGQTLELGPLEIGGALAATDLRTAVRAAILEGCVGETLAAHEASCLAALAEDPEVAAVLTRIADDEARHAALAWGFVSWAVRRDPSLRALVAETLTSALTEPAAAPAQSSGEAALALGCPSPGLRARWRALGLRELVTPCARHLLGTVSVGYQSPT